jgi:uncharacterized protein (DUF2235 family)
MASRKRLIVCCDGTWNDADSGSEFTNVARLSWAILPLESRGGNEIPQIVYYHSGVGTGDILDRAMGGGVGMGLSRHVRDAYSFIANNYCDGDEIFLFGFSRGAYTARSIGGLIGYAGLLHKHEMDRFASLWESYRLRGKPGHVDILNQFPQRHFPIKIKCVGVWDTVGALGIPGHLDQVFTSFYQFHDTGLGVHIENAFHALALDEMRVDFQPTLWIQNLDAKANGQVLKQVWFAGVHSNVGGGYDEHGLSDVALAWMAGQIESMLAIDTDYLKEKRDRRNGWGLGRIYDSAAGIEWKIRGTKPRSPMTNMDATSQSIHGSVAERLKQDAACVPKPYVSNALKGLDVGRSLSPLSDLEKVLKWTPAEIEVPDEKKPQASLLNRVLDTFGGG